MLKSLRIGPKILIVLSVVAIAAIGIIGYQGYSTAKESLEQESFNKLTAVREMKANQIEDYFQQIADQVRTLSEDRMIIEAMQAFDNALHGIEADYGINEDHMNKIDVEVKSYYQDEFLIRLTPNLLETPSLSDYWPQDKKTRALQHLYITSNSNDTGSKYLLDNAGDPSRYSTAHEIYHPIIRSYLEKFGYYDIFLVDVDTGGHIAYTVFKEVDYGTSLLTGPYKDTNFAEAYRSAASATDKDFVKLVDFDPYHPSYNAPASFISSPIFDGDEIIGVLLFQMPIDKINDIMTNKHQWSEVGLGKSGETYIVGDDFLLRNQSRFLIEDRDNYLKMIQKIGLSQEIVSKIDNFNSSIGLQPVKTQGTEAAQKDEIGTAIFPDYRGVSVLSSYKPLDIPDVDWVIMSEIDEAEAFAQVHKLRKNIYTWLIILIISIVIVAFFFSKTITRPLNELTKYSQELSQHDFHAASHFQFSGTLNSITKRHDEVGDLAQSFQRMEVELGNSIENLKKTTSAKERMESELNIGHEIQMSMLPLLFPAYPERKEFNVHADLFPAREVGGDFYDFYFLEDNLFGFCIGDVSGKGVPAALFMAVTKTLIKSKAMEDSSPASVLSHVNDELSVDNKSSMFVTAFLGILDVKTGELVYANAGHNPPYIVRRETGLERIDKPHGVVLGAMGDMVYNEGHVKLNRGDTILLYTDGVTEAMNSQNELFSEKRLVDLLSSRKYESVDDTVHSTAAAVKHFENGANQADDVTILAVEYLGAAGDLTVEKESLEFKNQPSEISRIIECFNGFAKKYKITDKARQQISTVVDELIHNIISYAYDDDKEHDIILVLELAGDRLKMTITDDGKPFNPFDIETPDTSLPLEERKVGGLGIHLVRSIMDRVFYHRRANKNVITLVKHLATDNNIQCQ